MSLQLQLSAGTLSKSMSRMGSCEEALLPGDAGEARVSAGAPAAAVAAGAERTVPSLWVEPGDAVTPSEEATDDTGIKNPARKFRQIEIATRTG